VRCRHVQERLVESRLRGDGHPPEGLAPHLERCQRCAEEYEVIARGVAALEHLKPVVPPAGMKAIVFDRIAEERTRDPWHVRSLAFCRRPSVRIATVACLLLAALGATVVLSRDARDKDRLPDAASLAARAAASAQAIDDQALLSRPYVVQSARAARDLREAELYLDEAANVGHDPVQLAQIGRRVDAALRAGLADRIAALAADAPDDDQRALVQIIDDLKAIARCE